MEYGVGKEQLMVALKSLIGLAIALVWSIHTHAETYMCTQNGKTVIADSPCAHNADRVDQQADKVNRSQQRQAESIHMKNQVQLSELEWKARQDRHVRGGVQIVPGPASPADTPRRSR